MLTLNTRLCNYIFVPHLGGLLNGARKSEHSEVFDNFKKSKGACKKLCLNGSIRRVERRNSYEVENLTSMKGV